MSKCVTAIVIGAGNRGYGHAAYAGSCPDKFKIVGVAEPREFYRQRIVKEHNISEDKVFKSWNEVAAIEKFADAVIIATQDQMHREPAIAFAKKGYHILLEKPMAVSFEDCRDIVDACNEAGILLAVCHVLRYSAEARKLTELLQSGVIGDVVHIQHREPVGDWHFAHSFVRGNWRSTKSSTFSLLAKSCHDIDLLQMWMGGKRCTSISSFGSLKHFTASNKPANAGTRCVDCKAEKDCAYSAKRIYLGMLNMGNKGWPVDVLAEVPDIESVTDALTNGPYGKCVYGDCGNDVVDNQAVIMQFEGGATVSFTMVAFSEDACLRKTNIFGSKGEISCDFGQHKVKHFDFLTRTTKIYDVVKELEAIEGGLIGHNAADWFTIEAFVKAVAAGDSRFIVTGPSESLYSHYLCFMAEKSRLENRTIALSPSEMKVDV